MRAMKLQYNIKNKELKHLVEKKAKSTNTAIDELIKRYVNRGVFEDGFGEDAFARMHSKEFLNDVKKALYGKQDVKQ